MYATHQYAPQSKSSAAAALIINITIATRTMHNTTLLGKY
jgi:hypothetical protein